MPRPIPFEATEDRRLGLPAHRRQKARPRAFPLPPACLQPYCPSWVRTRTLLIQSQACCQLHQGAPSMKRETGLEPATLSLGS
jgi:hypothetical protein